MSADPASARVQALTTQAWGVGLRLVRAQSAPYWWQILAISDGALVCSARKLEDIARELGRSRPGSQASAPHDITHDHSRRRVAR